MADKNYQYMLFAAEPYNTIAFKIPMLQIDRSSGKYITSWDANKKVFIVQVHFLRPKTAAVFENKEE